MSASPIFDPAPPVRGPGIIDHLKNSERLMTTRELASILAISPKTIYSYAERNMIPHFKIEASSASVDVMSLNGCWELFDAQAEEYRRSVFPPSIRARLAVEAGATQGWHRYVGDLGDVMGLDHFGASAPAPVLMREYGFTVENVCKRARALLEKNNP